MPADRPTPHLDRVKYPADLRGLSGDTAETDDWDVEGAMATEGPEFIPEHIQ